MVLEMFVFIDIHCHKTLLSAKACIGRVQHGSDKMLFRAVIGRRLLSKQVIPLSLPKQVSVISVTMPSSCVEFVCLKTKPPHMYSIFGFALSTIK